MTVEEKIAECFDGLRESPSPHAWSQGGPRTEDITIYRHLPISEVDGGAINVLDALEETAQQEIPALLNEEEQENFYIASAFVLYTENLLDDTYDYLVTLSINR